MGFFDRQTEDTNRIWAPQAKHFEKLYGIGSGLYDQTKDLSDWEKESYGQARDFYGGAGQSGQELMGQGRSAWDQGMGYANQGMSAGPSQIEYNYQNVQDQVNNPMLQGQIDAATRDVYRDFRENQIPQAALGAAGSGGVGGSRQHQMEAIMGRGALESAQDISAQMRGQAYNQAMQNEMGRAQNQAQMNQGWNQNLGAQGMQMAGMGQGAQLAGFGMGNQGLQQSIGMGEQMRMSPWQAAQAYQGLIGPAQMIGMQSGPSMFSQVASGLGSLGSAASGFF
jgi:hypothetical protein